MEPQLDSEIKDVLTWLPSESGTREQTLPIGPMRFVNGKDGNKIAVAVGKENEKPRKEQVATLKH